jgi:hypothetical protein
MSRVRVGCGYPKNQKSVQKVKTYSGFDFFVLAHRRHTNSKMRNLALFAPPPPQIAMKSYIDHLNKLAILSTSKHSRERPGSAKSVFEPLETQITRWWTNLPQASRERAFLISEIAGVCRGRFKERPALRDLAAALRTMGWTQQRDWRKAGNNRRVWMNNEYSNQLSDARVTMVRSIG